MRDFFDPHDKERQRRRRRARRARGLCVECGHERPREGSRTIGPRCYLRAKQRWVAREARREAGA